METNRALACLDQIDPGQLDYDQWLRVGLALHNEGCSAADWESWSRRDYDRFHDGECAQKWKSFSRSGTRAVTIATLADLVKQHGGLVPPSGDYNFDTFEGGAMDWEDYIEIKSKPKASSTETPVIVDPNWLQDADIPAPSKDWHPVDFERYLSCMFESEDLVGIVTDTWHNDRIDKWVPQKGTWGRTASQLIEALHKSKNDLGAVIGDCKPEVGAWIRINPLDGEGCRDENVTAFRHALLEADDDELGHQFAAIRELEIPCSCLVHSGKRSIHALVKVNARNVDEYRKRVDYLYKIASKNGLKVDQSNKNPSRLSRLPGVLRDGNPQYMISGRCGRNTWEEWAEWIEDLKDDLPDPEHLSSLFDNLPPLADELIVGVLRTGHKLLLAGPSKAGKSFALIQLCVAMAEGSDWLGMPVKQGPVLYMNLELDRRSCLHRFKWVYEAMGLKPKHLNNIDIWNLRGHAVPLNKLVPKLLRRAAKKGYVAVIIDPIYKVQTGDENSAEDMAKFCNQFDRIANELGTAVIYCHHHSKGSQGQKRSIDRAAGSGVFGRDPDAVLDFIELEINKERRLNLENKVACDALKREIINLNLGLEPFDEQDMAEIDAFLSAAQGAFPKHVTKLTNAVYEARVHAQRMSGWRVESTLREFATPKPSLIWFDYPHHISDKYDLLKDAKAAGEELSYFEKKRAQEDASKAKAKALVEETEMAIKACGGPGVASISEIADELCISAQAVRTRIKKHTRYVTKSGLILKKEKL